MTEWLNLAGAIGTVGMGLLGLLAPGRASGFVGLKPLTPAGTSEFRATYGGLWIALGLVPILSGDPLAYLMAGLCWALTAVGRLVSIVADAAADAHNWGATLFEAAFAALLIAGAPAAQLGRLAGG
ncbi:MAG: DUF4345 family protein [Sandaracinobacter sp.]